MSKNQSPALNFIPVRGSRGIARNHSESGVIHLLVPLLIVGILIVVGYIVYQQVIQQPTSTTAPKITTPTDSSTLTSDMADWETYINPVHNYSIKYPDKYLVTPQTAGEISQLGAGNNICIKDSDGVCLIVINAFTTAKTLDGYKQWAKTVFTKSNYAELEKASKGVVGAYPALITDNGTVYVQLETGIFQITRNNDVPEMDQILSTFEFLD